MTQLELRIKAARRYRRNAAKAEAPLGGSVTRDPFRIIGPACISFSGGRTSGYMLWRILQAHGGTLPDDVVVVFANTGKEMPETLDFVEECRQRWSVPIVWLEYRSKAQVAVVTYETASRNGEPFADVIKDRNFLPNPVARFCTAEMKVKTILRYMRSIGMPEYQCAVGLRADEQRRVAKVRADPSGGSGGVDRVVPLADAGVSAEMVGDFWRRADFDLRLPNMNGKTMHGNCDLCFLKGGEQILSLIRENPSRAKWWIAMENSITNATVVNGGMFRSDRPSYSEMHRMATQHGELFGFDEPLQDCACTD
jgi:3'-phosphoadenosine 5'-phosphosulfate sulfotransferase (PAPS reductase)/FAD synthetase